MEGGRICYSNCTEQKNRSCAAHEKSFSCEPRGFGAGQDADRQQRQRQARALHHRPGPAKAVSRPIICSPQHYHKVQPLGWLHR